MHVQSLGVGDILEEEMTTRSSSLAWKTPWTEEPGGGPVGVPKSQIRQSTQAHAHTRRVVETVKPGWVIMSVEKGESLQVS